MKNLCSSTCLSAPSKTQSATDEKLLYTLYKLFSWIKNHFWPMYLSFFFLSFLSFCTIFFSLHFFFLLCSPLSLRFFFLLCSPLCSPLWWLGLGWRSRCRSECGFAQRGLGFGFARRSQPRCVGLHRSRRGGGAVGVVVGLPILRCLWCGWLTNGGLGWWFAPISVDWGGKREMRREKKKVKIK